MVRVLVRALMQRATYGRLLPRRVVRQVCLCRTLKQLDGAFH